MTKFKEILLFDKIPGILCVLACMISVGAGFGLGYIYFERANVPSAVYAAEAVYSYRTDNPFVVSVPLDAYEPTIMEYHHPPEDEETIPHLFLVTTLDGYIVIYHSEENGGGIKELTNTSVNMLAPEELELLKTGIRIYTNEALARILQDYGS